MYRCLIRRLIAVGVAFGVVAVTAVTAVAQAPTGADPHQHDAAPPADAAEHQHDMHDMQHDMSMRPARDGSGTSWLPDETLMYAVHWQRGAWTFMGHGNMFLQYLHDAGARGEEQGGSVNWVMGMADRAIGEGHVGLRAMFSLEPWTIRGCGYPDLLASGEVCNGEAIHDRQHPHDLSMELAATYDRPLMGDVRWQVYGGPAGEPALGPVAFPHRLSAMPNPLAPITHHWLDATHIAFGVVTGGLYAKRWKAETSIFNGREPDEKRTGLDLAPLDSWSGRLWWLPADRWALQVSGGRLHEAEPGHEGDGRIDINRVTASATYHRKLTDGGIWASTVGWGRNQEGGTKSSSALLGETNLTLNDRDTWFGRVEWSQKSGHDLDLSSDDIFAVAKLQAAYTRYFASTKGLKPGIGAGVSLGLVPRALETVYGSRTNAGIAVFFTVRPASPSM